MAEAPEQVQVQVQAPAPARKQLSPEQKEAARQRTAHILLAGAVATLMTSKQKEAVREKARSGDLFKDGKALDKDLSKGNREARSKLR